MRVKTLWVPVLIVLVIGLAQSSASGQSLRDKIDRIFQETLEIQLGGSPGAHQDHFRPSNVASSRQIIDALQSFISANASAIPLSSTVAAVSFDFSTGMPVRRTSGLGPIFAENGTTLGKSRMIFGFNLSHMKLNKIRGLDMDNMRLSFTHQDVGPPGLGDSENELETIDLLLPMEMEASVLAFYTTMGLTSWLDISMAVPFINLRLQVDPFASINSFTLLVNGAANHFYDGTAATPILSTTPTPINDTATGIGDIALRAKVNLMSKEKYDFATLVGVRLPTGSEDNFLGSGDTSVKGMMILSRSTEGFSPHANLAYELKTSELDSDELEFFAGFDQKVTDKLTAVVDFLGEWEVEDSKTDFGQTETIKYPGRAVPTSLGPFTNVVELTNIPDRKRDHNLNASFGVKYAPRDSALLIANVIIPLNDGGIRAAFIPTIGFEFNF